MDRSQWFLRPANIFISMAMWEVNKTSSLRREREKWRRGSPQTSSHIIQWHIIYNHKFPLCEPRMYCWQNVVAAKRKLLFVACGRFFVVVVVVSLTLAFFVVLAFMVTKRAVCLFLVFFLFYFLSGHFASVFHKSSTEFKYLLGLPEINYIWGTRGRWNWYRLRITKYIFREDWRWIRHVFVWGRKERKKKNAIFVA